MTKFTLIQFDKPLEDLSMWNRKPTVKERFAVQSESNPEQAYLVRRVECLRVPFEDADVVKDQVELTICSCPQYQFRIWPDTEPETLDELSDCKHCLETDRTAKAEKDESQTELC